MKGFELTLARRFGWKADGRKQASPAVAVACTGVALAMVVMLLSVAIMLGFKEEVTRRIMNLDDAITIASADSVFRPAELLSVLNLPAEAEIVGHTSVPAIVKTDTDFLGLELQRNDAMTLGDTAICLSDASARKLRLSAGDRVTVYFYLNERLRARMLTVQSTYSTGFAEHDDAIGYCSAALIANLCGFDADEVHSIGVRNVAAEDVTALSSAIYSDLLSAYYAGELHGAYSISNILQTNANLFSWLSLLDTNVVVIITLMSIVAAFTLISSLFIIILERVRTIGLLKSLGATNRQIGNIFMLMAERLVVRGLLIGNVVGLALIAHQAWTHAVPLDPTSYYVDYVPVRFSLVALIALNLGALVLSWLVLMLPAAIISRISPATTMRYE